MCPVFQLSTVRATQLCGDYQGDGICVILVAIYRCETYLLLHIKSWGVERNQRVGNIFSQVIPKAGRVKLRAVDVLLRRGAQDDR